MNFQEIFDTIKDDTVKLVELTLSGFKKQAIQEAHDFLDSTKDKLARWTQLLVEGSLTPDEFTFLLRGQEGLAKMQVLLQVGLTKIQADQFIGSLLNLVVKVVVAAIP